MNITALTHTRTIHLIDIENLCGQSAVTVERAREARAAYEAVVPVGEHDHIVVASARYSAFAAYAVWPEARRLWRDGKDGADICLASVITYEHVHERFGAVVLGSGDGGFTAFAEFLIDHGVNVSIVSRESALSGGLRATTGDVRLLDLDDIEQNDSGLAVALEQPSARSFDDMLVDFPLEGITLAA